MTNGPLNSGRRLRSLHALAAVLLLSNHYEVLSDCGGAAAPPVNDAPATALAMGVDFGCAVDEGEVRCWGKNASGQLGRGTQSAGEPTAQALALPAPVAQLALGDAMACARTTTGRVFCWGSDEVLQLGVADAGTATPREVQVPVPVQSLLAQADFVLALGSDGRLFGWGNDAEGTLARGDVNTHVWPLPREVVRAAFDLRFTAVSAGQGHACGLDASRTLWCWGRNTEHQLGTTDADEQYRVPVKVRDGVDAVATSAFGGCALHDGALACWGDYPLNESGLRFSQPLPADLDFGGARIRSVAGSWFHWCAVTDADALWCWGRGIEGQLGLGDVTPYATPQHVQDDVAQVAVGRMATCLRKRSDSSVWCTGLNDVGQLGLGDTRRRSTPAAQP